MKIIIITMLALFAFNSFSADVTASYDRYYADSGRLTSKDLNYLSSKEIIFVPGILSEVFSREDTRGGVDFSVISSDYFASQVHHFKNVLRLPTQKLLASSRDITETKTSIGRALRKSRSNNRKALLIAHSLGGLALIDYLLESDESELESIEGILFMQSPFYGTPVASLYLSNPYDADRWLRPFLPFFNVSIQTIEYLSTAYRMKFMQENEERIAEILKKIPVITMSGSSAGDRSIFAPGADVIKHGCLLNTFGRCLTRQLYAGPYDESDGLVPVKSSKLKSADSIVLDGIDHGETIVKLPLQRVSRENMTESLLKVLMERTVTSP